MKKFILLNLLFSSFVYSQTNGTTEQSSSKIKVYVPSSSSASSLSDSYKWTVKTDVLGFASGEFPIIGEYRFSKKMSAEISAGATYGLYDNFGVLSDGYDGGGRTFETKSAIGSAFRGGIKYYPSSDYDAIEGWAFGIQFFSRTNNRDYTSNGSYDTYDLNGKKDSKSKTGLAITISRQLFSDSNISTEFLIGIGFASVKHEFLTENYDSESGYLKTNTTKETIPNFQFGFRIGFGN